MIDLEELATISGLHPEAAPSLIHAAAVALQRRHEPGVELRGSVRGVAINEALAWIRRDAGVAAHEERKRCTEMGAEAVALALAGARLGWRVRRRLQSTANDGADWLMNDPAGDSCIVEVSGVDDGPLMPRLREKQAQARGSVHANFSRPAACVVRFLEPEAVFWCDDDAR